MDFPYKPSSYWVSPFMEIPIWFFNMYDIKWYKYIYTHAMYLCLISLGPRDAWCMIQIDRASLWQRCHDTLYPCTQGIIQPISSDMWCVLFQPGCVFSLQLWTWPTLTNPWTWVVFQTQSHKVAVFVGQKWYWITWPIPKYFYLLAYVDVHSIHITVYCQNRNQNMNTTVSPCS